MNEIYQKSLTLSQQEHYSFNSLKVFQHDTFPQDEFKVRSLDSIHKKTQYQESGASTLENLRNLDLHNQKDCAEEDSLYNWEDALATLERKTLNSSVLVAVKTEYSDQKSNIHSYNSGNSSNELGKLSSIELSGASSIKKNQKRYGLTERTDQKMVSEENTQREYREIHPVKMYIKAAEPKKVSRKNQRNLLISNSKMWSSQRSSQSMAQKRNFETARYKPSQPEIKEEFLDDCADFDDEIEDVEDLSDVGSFKRSNLIHPPNTTRSKFQNLTNHTVIASSENSEPPKFQSKVEKKPSSLNDMLKIELVKHQTHHQPPEKRRDRNSQYE